MDIPVNLSKKTSADLLGFGTLRLGCAQELLRLCLKSPDVENDFYRRNTLYINKYGEE